MELHWCEGLNFFGPFGLKLAIVSHWDNTSGGAELDTSRCYMGLSRFTALTTMLPATDHHPRNRRAHGAGPGHGGRARRSAGSGPSYHRTRWPRATLRGPGESSAGGARDLPPALRQHPPADRDTGATCGNGPNADAAPPEVLGLVAQRERARAAQDWAEADRLREKLLELGWNVQDTTDGPRLSA